MLFSVIIPTYNRLPLLRETLQSVWKQEFKDFEVIVVDDGSTDGTAQYLKGESTRLKWVAQSNLGAGAARNAGAAIAEGEYLAFLDSDDLWFPWTLATVAEVIMRFSRPALISGALHAFSNVGELKRAVPGKLSVESFTDYLSSSQRGFFIGSGAAFINAADFHSVGGFDITLRTAEDHDLSLRLATRQGFVQITSPRNVAYRRHAGNLTTNGEAAHAGLQQLLEHENTGAYPGGAARALERRAIITLHTRPATLALLVANRQLQAWRLFASTFFWNVAQHRWKFILGFPLLALRSMVLNVNRAHR